MKAIIINAYASPDVLQESIIPVPKVGPRQVLIKIIAAGVNPIDWKIRKFRFCHLQAYSFKEGHVHNHCANVKKILLSLLTAILPGKKC